MGVCRRANASLVVPHRRPNLPGVVNLLDPLPGKYAHRVARRPCSLCGLEAETAPPTSGSGFTGWSVGTPLRIFIDGADALLHHACADPVNRDLVDPDREWFYCWRPNDEITKDTLFDRCCEDCERAWVTQGAWLWNSEGPSFDEATRS